MSLMRFNRADFAYQAAYCEENIWQLCQKSIFQNSYALFIFSRGDAFPMLNQLASQHPSLPIYWDYHVVLLHPSDNSQIFDFDTTLDFPTDIQSYIVSSFIDEHLLSEAEKPLFRLVPALEFTTIFASDRSHMRTAQGWLSPPPKWPCIGNTKHNLADFLEAAPNHLGELLSTEALLNRITNYTSNAN